MKSYHNPRLAFLASTLAIVLVASVRADDTSNVIKFSDPSKPGTVKINLGRSELRVQGTDTNEVTVKSEAKAITSKPRKDGLRVLSAASSYALSEKDNVVTLDAASQDGGKGGDFRLTVPRNTMIVVQNAWGGDISCTSISGDIEMNNMHGEIRLDDVSGGIVAGTMNGEIRATIRELHEGKPLSFTSMNGEIMIRVPEAAKANVRLRTQNGSVLTDFDEAALVTKTENTAMAPRGKQTAWTIKSGKGLTVEIQDAIREATQVSATAVREALEAVKEGLEASRVDTEDAKRQLEDARKQIERARRDMDRDRRVAVRTTNQNADATPTPPAPPSPAAAPAPGGWSMGPKIAIVPPTISGGKLITGTLNGGGPEISVSTMNGDVTLRKLDLKK